MILPDVNILIYAHNDSDERFERASSWFRSLMDGDDRVCFCWETINGFVRVSTSHRAMPRPIPLQKALSVVDNWLDSPNALLLEPLADHWMYLQKVALRANASGPLFSDAVLATFAISHNATLASTDRDFRLFDGLRLIDPLSEN
jgi:uncharacterized protein